MKNTRSSGDGLEAGDAVTAAQMRGALRSRDASSGDPAAGTAPTTLI